MKITLCSQKTISEVKQEFTKTFPFLKIEFFKKKHHPGQGSPIWEEVEPSHQLIDVSGVLKEGAIELEPTDTVKAVEQKFQYQYGLPVQIFRRQNGLWMETTVTDDLTLREQNTLGRATSIPLKSKTKIGERYIDWE